MPMNAPPPRRKAVNLSLLAEAKALNTNLSRTVEAAPCSRLRDEKARRWQEENAEAIAFSNAQVGRDGLWCDDYRLF